MRADIGGELPEAVEVEGDRGDRRAAGFSRRAAVLLALGVAVAVISFDQATKAAITARSDWYCGNPTFYPVLGPNAGFSFVCNRGAAFSSFQNSPLVVVPVLIALAAVGWLWVRSLDLPGRLQQVAFGLVIGGAIGNLIDRSRYGYVIDFVDLRLNETYRWYVFNVADASICIGVACLALAFWRGAPR
jgi:signal peptidase II